MSMRYKEAVFESGVSAVDANPETFVCAKTARTTREVVTYLLVPCSLLLQPIPDLAEDVMGDDVGVVAGGQADEKFAVLVAELLHVAEPVPRPADGEKDNCDVGPRDLGFER